MALLLAVVATVTALIKAIDFISDIHDGWLSLIISAIALLLSVILAVGFWLCFAAGRSKSEGYNERGVHMLSGVFTFYEAIVCIVMVLIGALCLIILIAGKSCSDRTNENAASFGDQISALASAATTAYMTALIGIFVAVVIVFVVIIVYFTSVSKFIKRVESFILTRNCPKDITMLPAIFFFIMGGVSLIFALGSTALFSALSSALKSLSEETGSATSLIESVSSAMNTDALSVISKVASSLLYIFGGIIVLKMRGLDGRIRKRLSLMKAPEQE